MVRVLQGLCGPSFPPSPQPQRRPPMTPSYLCSFCQERGPPLPGHSGSPAPRGPLLPQPPLQRGAPHLERKAQSLSKPSCKGICRFSASPHRAPLRTKWGSWRHSPPHDPAQQTLSMTKTWGVGRPPDQQQPVPGSQKHPAWAVVEPTLPCRPFLQPPHGHFAASDPACSKLSLQGGLYGPQ